MGGTTSDNCNNLAEDITILNLELSFLHALLKTIDQYFLNGPCRSNHIVRDLSFLKIFELEKMYEPLMKT